MGPWFEGQPESVLRMLMHIDYHFGEGARYGYAG